MVNNVFCVINNEVGQRHHITAHDTIQLAQVQYFGIECACTDYFTDASPDAQLGKNSFLIKNCLHNFI